MTAPTRQNIARQLRRLRADRKAWLTGQRLHWGVPWCHGRGSPYCEGPGCMGCATASWCRGRAAEFTAEIKRLEALLAPVAQGALW